MKRERWTVIAVGIAFLLPWISPAAAETEGPEWRWKLYDRFLARPNTHWRYDNFGWQAYRDYSTVNKGGNEFLPVYSALGEHWVNGSDAYQWEEYRTLSPDWSSRIYKWGLRRFDNVIIARDGYKDWSMRLTVANYLQTSFTSLTLDLPRFNGIRWDGAFRDHEFTLAVSRPSDPAVWTFITRPTERIRDRGTLLFGGRWEGRFLLGNLRLGATAVNLHRFDSMESEGDFLRGIAPAEMTPDTVAVRFMDDSPRDGIGGAVVFDVRAVAIVREEGSRLERAEALDPVGIVSSPGAVFTGRHWEANGDEFVEYLFIPPPNAADLTFEAEVANDYRIAVRQSHHAKDRITFQEKLRQTPLVTVRRAEDNVMDRSNKRWVSFHYGLSTAMNIVGFDGELTLAGFHLSWEYARSICYFKYPLLHLGKPSVLTGDAWYLRGAKVWGPLTLGAEYFSIAPTYSSYAMDAGDFTGGKVFETTVEDYVRSDFEENTLGFYFNELQSNPLNAGNLKRYHVPYLMDDNDDDDQFSDQSTFDRPFQGQLGQLVEAGVYPGFDADQDGVPDNNRNRNQIPDCLEPFFKYWQDPDEFYWGEDFNNNGVVDRFEDDSLPDYPYDKDERGPHMFLSWRPPISGAELTAGGYTISQIAGGGGNRVRYGSVSYLREFPGRGRIELHHETKRVWDDIRNGTFRYELTPNPFRTVYASTFVEDDLNFRDSWVHRGALEAKFSPAHGLSLTHKMRYEANAQQAASFSDSTTQDRDDIMLFGVVNKADYAFRYGDLVVKPMLKHLFLTRDVKSHPKPSVRMTTLTPILIVNYRITDRTSLQAGAEGTPLLRAVVSDGVDEAVSFESEHYLLQGTVKGTSSGYNVFITLGIQHTKLDYDEPEKPNESVTLSFVRVTLGEQVLASAQ